MNPHTIYSTAASINQLPEVNKSGQQPYQFLYRRRQQIPIRLIRYFIVVQNTYLGPIFWWGPKIPNWMKPFKI